MSVKLNSLWTILNFNMVKLVKTLYFLPVFSLLVSIRGDDRFAVNTTYGTVIGKLMISREGREFTAFLGIPYAAPPTGQLRFMPPQQPQAWEGLRNATEEGNVCIQRDSKGEEDCLYLNIFKHNNKTTISPVMVFIHGGGFYGGSSAIDTYGPEYFMDIDIVLVTIQYRLGVFGFLSTEDKVISGNMGLKDQRRALQWVQENIRAFDGDPLKVTIFGNSAGSSSVHLHMISPSSKDLFAGAISQSGTALSAFSRIRKGTSRNITKHLAEMLNCPTNSSEEILQCLLLINSSRIQEEYSILQDSSYKVKRVLFRPVIEELTEHAFLTTSPQFATTDKPWLVGVNANEGLFKINLNVLNETMSLIQTKFDEYVPAIVFLEDNHSVSQEAIESIYNFYFKNTITTNDTIKSLEQLISDSWFIWPTEKAIRQHKGILYCYLFDHLGQHSFTQIIGGPQGFGVSHIDELHYLFPQKQMFPTNMNTDDTNMSKLMVNMWTNFANWFNPTPNLISDNPQAKQQNSILWTPSNSTNTNYLHIETHKLSIVDRIFLDRITFWKNLLI